MADAATPDAEPGTAEWWHAHLDRLARRRPRAGGLTVERVVDEALALVDAEGLDALTVRQLAARLGTSSATLYRHVASVEELLVLMTDRVVGDVQLPDVGSTTDAVVSPGSDPGRDKIVRLAIEFRRVLVAHPGVVPALRAAPMLGPNATASATFGLVAFLEAGYRPEVAVPGYLALIDYVLGSVFFDTAGAADRDATARRGERVSANSLLDPSPISSVAVSSATVFRFAIDAFLDGMPRGPVPS